MKKSQKMGKKFVKFQGTAIKESVLLNVLNNPDISNFPQTTDKNFANEFSS